MSSTRDDDLDLAPARSEGVGMPGVTQPAHDPGADGVEPDPAAGERPLHPARPTAEAHDILPAQEPVRGEDPVAQEADALVARKNHALVASEIIPSSGSRNASCPARLGTAAERAVHWGGEKMVLTGLVVGTS
ncbi:MAG: hypothetical protein ACHRXM_19070 [Isosphaerales bacterium]